MRFQPRRRQLLASQSFAQLRARESAFHDHGAMEFLAHILTRIRSHQDIREFTRFLRFFDLGLARNDEARPSRQTQQIKAAFGKETFNLLNKIGVYDGVCFRGARKQIFSYRRFQSFARSPNPQAPARQLSGKIGNDFMLRIENETDQIMFGPHLARGQTPAHSRGSRGCVR